MRRKRRAKVSSDESDADIDYTDDYDLDVVRVHGVLPKQQPLGASKRHSGPKDRLTVCLSQQPIYRPQ